MMESHMNNGMCRCCSSEGTFKDVKSKYNWMGEEEVYSEMLRECFDIVLSSNEGDDGGICEVCITQLRNAANFKKQVLYTEDQFKKRLNDKMLKSDIKIEFGKFDSDNESDNDNDNNMSEDFSAPEFDVPIKKEEDEPKPKKRAAAKATTSKAKKAKTNDGETSTKRTLGMRCDSILDNDEDDNAIIVVLDNGEVSKVLLTDPEEVQKELTENLEIPKDDKINRELYKHRINLDQILNNSNATPIRSYDSKGYKCCYCENQYQDPANLKWHTIRKHKGARLFGKSLSNFLVKLDITSLRCKLCDDLIDTVEDLMTHLIYVHEKPLFENMNNHMLPFKFGYKSQTCCICVKKFRSFRTLSEHMNTHYRNYICEICDEGFVNRGMLISHSKSHQIGTYSCDICAKEFGTLHAKKRHESNVHGRVFLFECDYCNEIFRGPKLKQSHMIEMHGLEPPDHNCNICNDKFDNQVKLSTHLRRHHLKERHYECTECDKKFFNSSELRFHKLKHTGTRNFECDVCHKKYLRKWTLMEHMRIHFNDRRFACELCGDTFTQKCSLLKHLRSKIHA